MFNKVTRKEADETDSGAMKVDIVQVKNHLMRVFGYLLSKEELMNGKYIVCYST